jgi:superkiller protein 3
MQRIPIYSIAARLLLLGLFVLVLTPAERPHRVRKNWEQLQVALENGDSETAAASLDPIAYAHPWRQDLRWAAARYALQAGNWQQGILWMGMLESTHLSAEDWRELGDAYLALGDLQKAEQAFEQSKTKMPDYAVYERLYRIHQQQADLPATTKDLQHLVALNPDDQDLAFRLVLYLAAFDPISSVEFLESKPITDEGLKPKAILLERKLKAALLNSQPEVQLLAAGQALADIQEWNLAKAAFQNALVFNPNYAEAWSFLGEARQHLNPPETEQALMDLRQGLSLNPNSVAALSMLALYWQREGDLSRAADLYRSISSLEPDNPVWFTALGAIENADGNLSNAEWYYKYALTLAPEDAMFWRLLANFYIINQIKIKEEALAAAQRAVELAPDDPNNLVILGQVMMLLDEIQNARALFLQALEIDPNFSLAYLQLGIADLFNGKTEQAYQYLLIARDLAVDSTTAEQAERLLSYYFPR